MSKVQMIRHNRVFNVDARLVPLLERRGGYQRRDMQAQQLPAGPTAEELAAAEKKAAEAKAQKAANAAAKKAQKQAGKLAAAEKKAAEAKDRA